MKETLVIEVAQEVTSDVTAKRNVVFGPLGSTEEMGNLTFCCVVAGITPVTNFSFFYINLFLQDHYSKSQFFCLEMASPFLFKCPLKFKIKFCIQAIRKKKSQPKTYPQKSFTALFYFFVWLLIRLVSHT